jgi:hypothetical protein
VRAKLSCRARDAVSVVIAAAALCLVMAGQTVIVPVTSFTLSWVHTVEKTTWEEDYLVAGEWLYLVAARIRGSGAGMEPPPGAVLDGGVWHYRPARRWHDAVRLARSDFGADYTLCAGKRCRPLQYYLPGPPEATAIASCASAALRERAPMAGRERLR